ncbi:MAG: T9SS type A sorting domain-containing protein [Candidatus Kapabacteria bacterium]|nr:T9SS type A sorting domain-containing protein [Candidatus Kapabacteria bacterium]
MNILYLLPALLIISVQCLAQWAQVNTGIKNLSLGAKLLGNSDTHLFCGTLSGGAMYRSSDAGNTWMEIQPPVAGNLPECGYSYEGKYFAGLNSSMNCIFYSTDNGSSWNSSVGAPQTTVVRGFRSVPGAVFAYTSSMGIYASTNGGVTWSAANTGLKTVNVIWMETIKTKVLAATIGGGVFVSLNNGAVWTQSNSGIAAGDLNAEAVWRMGENLYYMAQGGASYKSTDEGATWTAWTKPAFMGIGITEVYRNGANLYIESRHFSGGLRDSIYTTANEGATWTNITENLSASDLNASGITEFGGYTFIAYNLISPNLGMYRKSTTTDVIDKETGDAVGVHPNPFDDIIHCTASPAKDIEYVSFYDSRGVLVLTERSNGPVVNTSVLSNGMYMMYIHYTDNTHAYRKVMKSGS